jgi:hypothetical protein
MCQSTIVLGTWDMEENITGQNPCPHTVYILVIVANGFYGLTHYSSESANRMRTKDLFNPRCKVVGFNSASHKITKHLPSLW